MSAGITPLFACPVFAQTVADRIWRAWWADDGYPLAHILTPLLVGLTEPGLPVTFVAHQDGRFLGTASLIAADLADRPDLTPWVAALWVEPAARGQGLGRALADRAAAEAFARGFPAVWLNALPAMEPWYTARGWELVERGLGEVDLYRRSG